MTRTPTIALIDFRRDGHHPTHLHFFAKALIDLGIETVIFSPCSEAREWFPSRSTFVRLKDEVEKARWVRKSPASENAHRFLRIARRLRGFERERGVRFDLVFISTLYHGAASSPAEIDKIFPWKWVTVLIDSAWARENRIRHARRTRTFDSLAAFRAKNCAGVATLDHGIRDRLASRIGKNATVYWLPEISEPSIPNREFAIGDAILKRAGNRSIIAGLGQFGLRKGALQFIETVRAGQSQDWLFVWVGELDLRNCKPGERTTIEEFVANPPSNCFLSFPGRLAENDFDRLVEISTVLFACYRNHWGSSGVISKAAWFERPLVVHDFEYMAEMVREFDLGVCVDPTSTPSDYRDAIALALARDGFCPRYDEFRKRYSPEEQIKVVREMVMNALGTKPLDLSLAGGAKILQNVPDL